MPKLYNQREEWAIQYVLDMGFSIVNSNGDILKLVNFDYSITFINGTHKEYQGKQSLSKALTDLYNKQ